MMNEQLAKMVSPLLEWYRENARVLPWRETTDPYKIWISEIMLQQTRVAAVLGYYDRFLKAFPHVEDLAEADEEVLMKLWEGLGYYSRARNLQKAARVIANQYNGQFPDNYDELINLPGIGEYTAGAIASAAFGQPVPAVDGNVLRVLSRVMECYDDISDAKTKKRYKEMLADVMPSHKEDVRIFNQALMELGATICVPNGAPRCEQCPVCDLCQSSAHETMLQLPIKNQKKQRKIQDKTVFVLLREGAIALHKREDSGLLAGLWEFPNIDGALDEMAVYEYLSGLGLRVIEWKKQLKAKHIFTHIEWHMVGYVVRVAGEDNGTLTWAEHDDFYQYAIPSAFAKFTKEAESNL